MLSEIEGKAILAAYGIPVVPTIASAPEPAAAREASEALLERDGAVVLKILSDDITHKSDVGGVHLGPERRRARWRQPPRPCWSAYASRVPRHASPASRCRR